MDDPPQWLAVLAISQTLTWSDAWISVLWVLGLLLVNAFFVAVEFSLVSARRSRMVQLANEGNAQAELVKKAQEQLDRALSTTQLGITIASILLGWIGATRVAQVVRAGLVALMQWILPTWVEGTSLGTGPDVIAQTPVINSVAWILSLTLLIYLQLVWGELLPKTLAIIYAEMITLRLARLNDVVSRLLIPFVEVPRFSSRWILRLFNIPIPDQTTLYSAMTAEELQMLIASSVESGGIEEEERELLANVFEFGETVASEVMIPRTSVKAVPFTASVRDVLIEVAESGHSRYPVFEESLDDIKGIITVKDLVSGLAKAEIDLDDGIEAFIRSAYFEHEGKLIAELLPDMQKRHQTMVVIVDEFGGTAGLVTIKDLVEEIVGNLSDPEAENGEEPSIQQIDDTTYLIQAQTNIEEIRERLELDLPQHDDYQTIGGFMIYQMQKIPKVGEKLGYQALEFQVMQVEGPRLEQIRLTVTAAYPLSPLSDSVQLP